jgi:hypothetical protein
VVVQDTWFTLVVENGTVAWLTTRTGDAVASVLFRRDFVPLTQIPCRMGQDHTWSWIWIAVYGDLTRFCIGDDEPVFLTQERADALAKVLLWAGGETSRARVTGS